MTTDTYFESTAREYDDRTLRAQPRYEEMLAQLEFTLPPRADDVLELGCGTGALTGLLAARYPSARTVALDASGKMIEVAGERLERAGLARERVEFRVAAFEAFDLRAESYDLIASNMALHHIVDKEPFYRQIHAALRPGGTFVLGDELMGATPEVEQRHFDAWLAFARQPGHLTKDEIDGIVRHMEQFDHYETLPSQLALLWGAGFSQVDCTWRYLNYAVFVALP
jgi:tRNA (cmo5U34)-methyltransferase